jgi:site-specific DNA recombinase
MQSGPAIKTIAYFRKSSESEDRQVLSIPAQIDEINKILQAEKIVLEKSFSESHSAKNPGRPVFDEMLNYVQSGKANAIVSWAPNRLSRNSVDTGRLIHLMDLGKLLEVRTPHQVFKNNPNDKFLLNLFCSQAKLENDNKGEDVKRGLRTKVHQGWFPGAAPVGYLNTPDREKGVKIIIRDPKRFPLLRKVWDMALSGKYSVTQIHAYAKDNLLLVTVKRKSIGGKPLSKSGIYRILSDSFYYGEYEFPTGSGQYYKGRHEPMITKDEFDRVQMRLGSKGKPRPHKKQFAYTGPITCGECGCQVTAEEKYQLICTGCKHKFACANRKDCPKCGKAIAAMINPTLLHYTYYHCTKQKKDTRCSQGSVSLQELETQLKEYLARITIDKRYFDLVIDDLKKNNQHEAKTAKIILKNYQERYTEITEKLERLLELRLNNEINPDEFKIKKTEYNSEKTRLQELISNADHNQKERIQQCSDFFSFCLLAEEKFEEAKRTNDFSTLKNILQMLGSNLILKDKKLFIDLLEPFTILEKGLKNEQVEKSTFEPKKTLMPKGQKGDLGVHRPMRLPVIREIRTWFITQPKSALQDILLPKINIDSDYFNPVEDDGRIS